MTIRPPDETDLAAVAERYGLGLSAADITAFAPFATGLLDSWTAVEELYDRTAPAPPADRPWSRPADADNPLGAWYVTTAIHETDDGPLSGSTVTIKDNIMVAGVPMMNGSETLEGFVPTRDATVVTRLLDAGATIVGKAVCEDLCFSGGSHTSRTGPVRNPVGPDPLRQQYVKRQYGAGRHQRRRPRRRGRPGRLGAHPERVQRHGRAQADPRPRPLHRGVPDRADAGSPRSDHPHRGRRHADARGVAGSSGLDPRQPTGVAGADYVATLDGSIDGLRIGVVTEGFGIPDVSMPGVDGG